MAGNGRRLILPEGMALHHDDDVTTVGEWMSKPDRAASRGEVAAFVEAVVVNEVAPLIRTALQRNNREVEQNVALREMIARMIVSREADLRERRWFRRLWRRIRGAGNVGAGAGAPEGLTEPRGVNTSPGTISAPERAASGPAPTSAEAMGA